MKNKKTENKKTENKKVDIAILGATGVVGRTMIAILAERKFPVGKLYLLASHRSAGETIRFNNQAHSVIDVADFDFSKVQIALFSAGGEVSKQYAPIAAKAGCIVIDNTSTFRYEKDIPLIIPEVNADQIQYYKNRNIIANPNCSTIQMLVALKPIYDAVGITRINVATYQSVSGAGQAAISELITQCTELLNGRSVKPKLFPYQIAFNAIPQIDVFEENGYTREEMKMIWETKKILNDEQIQVNPTAVRIPVVYGHSEAIYIETNKKIQVSEVRALLSKAPGVIVKDERVSGGYPCPITEGTGEDAVYVGRIREDLSHERGLNLWVVTDNIRKGAALNSIQIAEILVNEYIECYK